MTTIHRNLVALTVLVASFCAIPGVAIGALDEITVTTERREASLQDTPIAVSALGRDQLEQLQISEARDLQRVVPSLNMFNNITHPSNLSLSLRGGVIQDASLAVAESPVGIYVDDIYVGRLNGNNVTLADIERVEVLRGPQGTLYGRNTSYGAIRFISRTPGEDSWLNGSVGAGNDSQALISGSAGGPLSDAVAGSLALRYFQKDGQYKNVLSGEEVGEEENLTFRGKLRYMGIENFDALLSVAYSNSENDAQQLVNGTTPNNAIPGNCPSVLMRPCLPGENATFSQDDLVFPNGARGIATPTAQLQPPPLKDRPQAETEQIIAGLTLSYDLNDDVTLKSITGLVQVEDDWHTDFNGSGALFTGASSSEGDQYTQEFQIIGTGMDERLNFVGGLYYFEEDVEQLFGWNGFGGAISNSLINIDSTSYSVFGDVSYNVTEKLRLIGGLRWTKDEKDFSFDFDRPAGVLGFLPASMELINNATLGTDGEWSEVTPRVVVEYTFGEAGVINDGMVYASAAKGYKGGSFSAISIITTEAVGVYEPDINWTYEVGLKADWWESRLRTNLAYFFSQIDDVQQNSTNPTGLGLEFPVGNIADAEIQGLEAEISFVPADGLTFFFVGTVAMDGEYSNLNPLGAAALAPDLYGVVAQTPQTPDYAISIGFDYTTDLPGELFGDLSFGADYYEIDDYVTAATNDFYNSGWDQVNAYVGVDIGENFELKLSGKNLGDEENITSGSRGLGGFVVSPPLEVLFEITYRMN